MSNIVNYKTGRTVNREDYVDDGFGDVYQRNLVESSTLPCIYSGFHVTAGSGLSVLVSPGKARGQDLTFTINGNTSNPLPTIVEDINTPTTIAIPPNGSGWIVLNVNVWAATTSGTNSNGDLYQISATTSATIPPGGTKGPMFVTSLQPNSGTTWPYTQIVLAAITANTSTVTVTAVYSPETATNGVISNRSFSWEDQVANTFNSGVVDLLNNTGKGLVNIPGFIDNFNTTNQVPVPTLAWQYGKVITSTGGNNTITVTLPYAFSTKMLFVIVGGQSLVSTTTSVPVPLPVFTNIINNSQFTVQSNVITGANGYAFDISYLVLGY